MAGTALALATVNRRPAFNMAPSLAAEYEDKRALEFSKVKSRSETYRCPSIAPAKTLRSESGDRRGGGTTKGNLTQPGVRTGRFGTSDADIAAETQASFHKSAARTARPQ